MTEQSEMTEIKMENCSEEMEKCQKKKGLIYQMMMSFIANISILGPAMSLGYSAVILPTLRSSSSDLHIDSNQESWIAGSAAFGTPIGCILSSFIMRKGRRLSLLVTSTFSLIGWVFIYLATDYEKLIVGRIVGGIATGLASTPATVYTAEIAGAKWRSTMVPWTSVAIALGILLVYIFGYFLQENWRLLALVCGLFPASAIILTILLIPESPIWLRDRGRLDEAFKTMKKFRGIPKDYPAPMELENELIHPNRKNDEKKSSTPLYKELIKRSSFYPFLILLVYFFFQQFSGVFVVVFYAVDITIEAGIKINAYFGAILIGLTRLIGSILVSFASKKWGRRIPSIISGTGMTFSMSVLSIYLYLDKIGYKIGDKGFIPAISIILYILMSTIGFLTLPFAMIGEIFPSKVKDILSGLTSCFAYIFSFIIIKIYPDLLNHMGKHGVFLFFSIISLVGTFYIIFFLPETKGKTLHQIDELFSKKRKIYFENNKEKTVVLKDLTSA